MFCCIITNVISSYLLFKVSSNRGCEYKAFEKIPISKLGTKYAFLEVSFYKLKRNIEENNSIAIFILTILLTYLLFVLLTKTPDPNLTKPLEGNKTKQKKNANGRNLNILKRDKRINKMTFFFSFLLFLFFF